MELISNELASECIFCEIINHADKNVIVTQTPLATALISLEGHTLVIPNMHISSANVENCVNNMIGTFKLAYSLIPVVKEAYGVDSISLIQNIGKSAGQDIDHLHLHLIPRSKGDKLVAIRVQEVDRFVRHANAAKLREILEKRY